MWLLCLIIIAYYLIGSIPFGLLLTRLYGLGDIRQIGSGNIGATNVLRTGNKKLALLTLVLDFCKAFLPLMALSNLLPPLEIGQLFIHYQAAILALIMGHMFPLWLGFKGGKGVACLFGVLFVAHWAVGLIAAFLWLSIFFATRYSSLAALIALPAAAFAAHYKGFTELFALPTPVLAGALWLPMMLMLLKHRQNIKRLLSGTEHRFSFGKKKEMP